MADIEKWESIARGSDPEDLRERILTGYRSGKPFTPYIPTVDLPPRLGRVLDFGCGLGRNFPYLKTIARHVTGFDLPSMIERCRTLAAEPVDALSANWDELSGRRFDLIVATLVLQHINPDSCRSYLCDFATMAPATYVLTRAKSDFASHVLETIAGTGLFDANECVEVEHDSVTHELRVLGRRPFDDVRRSEGAGHYEVLLQSRVLRRSDARSVPL